jgi:hypothetical protein
MAAINSRSRFAPCWKIRVTPEGRQALHLVLRATNGRGWEYPGPFLSKARTPSAVGPPRLGAFACWHVTSAVSMAFLGLGRWSGDPLPRAPPRAGHRPRRPGGTTTSAWSGLRPRGRGVPGVVARSDVDAVPNGAGQCGGPVMGHDGGHGGVDPPG